MNFRSAAVLLSIILVFFQVQSVLWYSSAKNVEENSGKDVPGGREVTTQDCNIVENEGASERLRAAFTVRSHASLPALGQS
ncbi:hypothetical protein B0H13DRAFT_2023817 [Mycena leptocephala]|nr:hypothetical protein B0H13DRAFT_2023817 [Mycena leptocephala]